MSELEVKLIVLNYPKITPMHERLEELWDISTS